jgi:hypothetical protein
MPWMMAVLLALAGAARSAAPGAALTDAEASAAVMSSRLSAPPLAPVVASPAAVTARPTAAGKTRIEFENTSVKDVLDYIAEVGKINIVYDKALADAGIDLSAARTTLKVTGLTIEQVIGLILPTGCAYLVQPNYVLITTAAKAQAALTTRMYDVRDLLSSPTNAGG